MSQGLLSGSRSALPGTAKKIPQGKRDRGTEVYLYTASESAESQPRFGPPGIDPGTPSPGFSPGRCPAGAGRCAAGAGGLAAVGPVPSAAVAGRGGGRALIGLAILAEGETVFRSGAAPDKFSGLADRAALLLSVWK